MAFLPIPQNMKTDEVIAESGSGGGLPLIPEGDYTGVIVNSEMKSTSTGGQMLVLTAVITQGQYKDTEFTDRLNIVNSNETAVKIAYGTLAKIAKALGMDTLPDDSNKLHNKPLVLEIKTEVAKPYIDKQGVERTGTDKSIIKGYKALPTSGNAPTQTTPSASPAGALPWKK